MNYKTQKSDYQITRALSVGFLVFTLATITVIASDPVKKQLLLSFAATAITPPVTNYQPAPLPIFATPSPSPLRSPSPSPVRTPSMRPTPTPGANGSTPLVSPCYGGCRPEDIMLPGQTPGRIGYIYNDGNIAGFYQAPNGLYYPVGQSAGGPTQNDLNGLAQTINLQRTATTDPNAYITLVQTNPTVAAETTAKLTAQCQQDRVPGITCTTTQGLAAYILNEHKIAEDLLMHIHQSPPGTYTDLQIIMDLTKLQQYLARNIISPNQYAGAVQQATHNINLNNATRVTPTPAFSPIGAVGTRPTTAPTQRPNTTGVAATAGVFSRSIEPRPTSTSTPGQRIVNFDTPHPRATAGPTPFNFAEYVSNAIREAAQSVGIGPTPAPSTRPATMPSTRTGLTQTGQTTTTYVNTDNGLITTTTEVVKDPATGRITDTNLTQTRITESKYEQTSTGIVRNDTIVTTDLTTGEVLNTRTTATQITNQSATRPGLNPTGSAGRVSATPTPTPRTPTIVTEIKSIISNIFNIPQNILNIGPTPRPTPTPFRNATPTNPPTLMQMILSGIFGTPPPSTSTTGVGGTTGGFGSILNRTGTPTPTPGLPGITGPNNNSGASVPQSVESAMIDFAENQTSQCYQAYGGYYNACIGGYYRNEILQPGAPINPLMGGNPEGNPNSMYFCTNLIIDAAEQVGVNIPNSTGALEMYSNFNQANSVIPTANIGQNGNSIIKPGMVAFVDKPTGVNQQPYNVGHVGLVQSVQSVGGVLQVTILQTNAETTQATYYMDPSGRLYTTGQGGARYYIRGFGDINQYAQNTNQTVTVPQSSNNSSSNTQQSNSGSPGSTPAISGVNQSMLNFATQQMQNCVPGRGGAYNACVGEYYNGNILTAEQAASLPIAPWESQLNNGDPTKLYWCTELVIDAAKNAGVPIGPNVNNIRPVHAMYNELQKHTTTYTQNDINAQNVSERLKPGMVVFINTPNVDPLSEFDHAAIIKDVNVVSTVDQNGNPQNMVNVTIVQSNSATVEATYEMDANGKLVYKAGSGNYNMVGFADLSNYVP